MEEGIIRTRYNTARNLWKGAAFILCKPAMLQQEIQIGQFFSKTGTTVSWCKTMSADSVQLQHHALSISSPHCTAVVSRLLYTPLRLLPILWVNFDWPLPDNSSCVYCFPNTLSFFEVVLFRQQRQYLFREMILTHSKDATAFPVYIMDWLFRFYRNKGVIFHWHISGYKFNPPQWKRISVLKPPASR